MENEVRFGCQCKRCGWVWYSKNDRPLVCPKCQSAYWDRERIQGRKGSKGQETVKEEKGNE